jgi:hypothetical protein
MLPLVLYYSALVVALIVAGRADDRDLAARGDRARAARLDRAPERWAEELDRRHGVRVDGVGLRPLPDAAGRRPVERRRGGRRRADRRRVA